MKGPIASAIVGVIATLAGSGAQAQPPLDYQGNCTDTGCHDQFTRRAVVHGPVSMDSCDACHEPTGGKKHTFKLTAEGGELCTDCHDEFPGKNLHSPFESGECTACHDPHASDNKGLVLADTLVELCTDCHDELLEELKFLHGPVAAGDCTTCHNPHASDHSSLLSAEHRDLCIKCHTDIDARVTGTKYAHDPATQGCVACHNPHGAGNNMMLNQVPPQLCLECHDSIEDLLDEVSVQHDAVTTGKACVSCHDPHASAIERLLLAEQMELCLSCHNQELDSNGGKIADIAQLLQSNPNHHGPVGQRSCTACHGVHGGTNYRMLIENFPARFYAPYDEEAYGLCFECHEPEIFEEEQTDDLTGFRNGEQNLHYLHVNRKEKGRTCRACHNPHASSQPKHITESSRFGAWELPVNYRPTSTGGSCQPGCHRKYTYDREKPVQNLPDS